MAAFSLVLLTWDLPEFQITKFLTTLTTFVKQNSGKIASRTDAGTGKL